MTGDILVTELRKIRALDKTVISVLSTSMPSSVTDILLKAGADFAVKKPNKIAEYETFLKEILAWKRDGTGKTIHKQASILKDQNQKKFTDLELTHLNDDTTSAVYIVDYNWNYLFANAQAKKNANGYDVVGKNIEDVWKDISPKNFWHVFQLLKVKADKKEMLSVIVTSPLTSNRVKITGEPYLDCYLFSVTPCNQDAPSALSGQTPLSESNAQ